MKRSTLFLLALAALFFYGRKGKGASSVPALASGYRWTKAEAIAFAQAVEPIGVPAEAALAVYSAESGLNPKASSGVAFGIPQATASTLRSIGWTRPAKEFASLSVTEQIPWISTLLLEQIRIIGYVPKSALDLYVANFSPAAAKSRADVIYRQGSAEYAKNAGLDRAKKGYIDRADLDRRLRAAMQTAAYLEAVSHVNEYLNQTKNRGPMQTMAAPVRRMTGAARKA